MNNFYIIGAAILLLSISSLFFRCSPSDRTTKNDRTLSTENQKSTVQNTENQKKSEINTEQNTKKIEVDEGNTIPLKVFENDFMIEINNIDEKGNPICSGDVIIINKTGKPFISLSAYFYLNITEPYSNKVNEIPEYLLSDKFTFKDNQYYSSDIETVFCSLNPETKTFVLIPWSETIKRVYSYCKDGNMYIEIINYDNSLSPIVEKYTKLVKEKAKAKIKERFVESGSEGYDFMPWGTEIYDFSIIYPTAEIIMNEDEIIVYRIKDETQKEQRLYYFFKNQLFRGQTIYNDVYDQSKSEAIIERLVELYGYSNDTKESTESKSKSLFGTTVFYTQVLFKVYWKKAPTFNIEYELKVLDGNDRLAIAMIVSDSLSTVTITYSNPKKDKEIDEYFDKLEKEKEAAKRKAEKDKLNF